MTQDELNDHINFLRWMAGSLRTVNESGPNIGSTIAEHLEQIAADLESANLAVDIPIVGNVK